MNNIIANIRTQLQKLKCRIANLTNRVTYIEDNCCNGGSGDGIQSIVPGDNITVDNTDPQNPIVSSTGGTTPTLVEVLAEGNIADRDIEMQPNTRLISGEGKNGTHSITFWYDELFDRFFLNMYGRDYININSDGGFSIIGGTLNDSYVRLESILEGEGDRSIRVTVPTISKGLVGLDYYGANYDDNTYVQKKYVDDNFLPLPTEGTAGQVLTTDGAGNYTWEDVEVQSYLQSITGYDAGETQVLKHVNGVLTWVTD